MRTSLQPTFPGVPVRLIVGALLVIPGEEFTALAINSPPEFLCPPAYRCHIEKRPKEVRPW